MSGFVSTADLRLQPNFANALDTILFTNFAVNAGGYPRATSGDAEASAPLPTAVRRLLPLPVLQTAFTKRQIGATPLSGRIIRQRM